MCKDNVYEDGAVVLDLEKGALKLIIGKDLNLDEIWIGRLSKGNL